MPAKERRVSILKGIFYGGLAALAANAVCVMSGNEEVLRFVNEHPYLIPSAGVVGGGVCELLDLGGRARDFYFDLGYLFDDPDYDPSQDN